MLAWFMLLLAILLEVSGTLAMKLSDGFSRPWFAVLTVIFYLASFAVLAWVLKRLEIGIAYAVWAGLGTVLVALLGVVIFQESISWIKMVSISLVVIGVIGLYLGA
ncbi:MAG: multidrug efflux SMR transporter [Methylothermaceae bacterium]|nr:multidrug efflux SMR transporter [Methylothermaceae bacterium]